MACKQLRCASACGSGHSGLYHKRSRCQCTTVRAAASEVPSEAPCTTRRGLLLGVSAAAAAAITWLRQPLPATAEEAFTSVIGGDDEPLSSPAVQEAAPQAAPQQQQQPNEGVGVSTVEGEVRLQTFDQATASMTPTDRQVFLLNQRVQAQNRAPNDFPGFIREGFDITVVGEGYTLDTTTGLIYKDFVVGSGSSPVDGQQVVFDYTGYNESGTTIDSSYRKGRAAEVRLGINGLIPGFELGIKGMKPGGKRRIVVPPALGPPVGPSTFFSAKQCEVFDVELRKVKTCTRRQMAMFSDVVCE